MKQYKQWSPEQRNEMYAEYKRLKKANELPQWVEHEGACSMCSDDYNTMPHAEDYGPTLHDYLKSLHVLCGRCHGMLHLRYRHVGHWVDYLEYIKGVRNGSVNRLKSIPHMGILFNQSNKWSKIDKQHTPNIDGEWYEQLNCDRLPKES